MNFRLFCFIRARQKNSSKRKKADIKSECPNNKCQFDDRMLPCESHFISYEWLWWAFNFQRSVRMKAILAIFGLYKMVVFDWELGERVKSSCVSHGLRVQSSLKKYTQKQQFSISNYVIVNKCWKKSAAFESSDIKWFIWINNKRSQFHIPHGCNHLTIFTMRVCVCVIRITLCRYWVKINKFLCD